MKRNKGKRKEKALQNNEYVKKGLAYDYSQENAWVDSELFQNYLEDIWFNMKYFGDNIKKRLLILDRATSYLNGKKKLFFQNIIINNV